MEERIMRHSGIIMLLAAGALLAGCAEENGLKETGNGEPVIFTATIAGTKTALSVEGTAGKMVWEDDDEITINGVAYVATPDPENPAQATFAPKGGAEAEPVGGKYYATYACGYDAAQKSGVLPAVQVYNENSLASVAPMYAESTGTELSFQNMCSLLEITLKGDAEVAGITLSSGNLPMSGKFIIDEEGLFLTEEATSVTLDCGGAKLTSDGVSFYVAVPAGSYWQLKIKVSDTDGKVWEIVAPKYAEVEGNKIYPFTFSPVFEEDIFVNGEYAVNAQGGKVKFVKGNLVYDNGGYSIEGSQTGAGSLFGASEFDAIDTKAISSEPIRTLSADEWDYLLKNTDKVKLFELEGHSGVVLIPNGVDYTTETAWSILEDNGAVFIPAAGYAYGDSAVCGLNEGGSYWTAGGSCFDFDACSIYVGNDAPATIRQSVRFVVDVKE